MLTKKVSRWLVGGRSAVVVVSSSNLHFLCYACVCNFFECDQKRKASISKTEGYFFSNERVNLFR